MKPIFNKEKILLEKYLGIDLPENCWRDGCKIYINHDSKCVIEFKVDLGKCKLKKNLIKSANDNKVLIEYKKGKKVVQEEIINYTYEEEYLQREAIIQELEDESIRRSIQYINEHPNYNLRISDSSGKDSKVVKHILENKVFPQLNITKEDYVIEFFNTTNEIAQTYLNIKQDNKDNFLEIHNPKIGWYQWIEKEKNYYVPSVIKRTCCDAYKHGRIKEILDKDKNYILFLGMRKYESSKRSEYDWDLNEHMKSINKLNIPENWRRFLPIVEWREG